MDSLTGFGWKHLPGARPMMHRSIHWFRKGLRLHDNPALLASLRDCAELWPVFLLDPWFPKNARVSVNRWRFLLRALQDLDGNLRKLGSRLFVVRGSPAEVFPRLFEQWKVTRLTFEVDTEPYARQRDAQVGKIAEEHGVEVIQKVSHTLYDTERILVENNGKAPLTYNRLQALLKTLGAPKRPVPPPTAEDMKGVCTPCSERHDEEFGVPTLEELGQDPRTAGPELYPGGETEALSRLDRHMQRTAWVCGFQKPNTEPNALSPSTTVLSPYLKFGCLSARTFWWRLTDVYRGVRVSKRVLSLHGQYSRAEFSYPSENGLSQAACSSGWLVTSSAAARSVPQVSVRVCVSQGCTGFPFIDAIMTQLRSEGWVHHLARHAVACFLTRGDLWISWQEGQKVFEELLLDADWALNAGNWQWLSASAFFHQYYRVYSPIAFGKKTDKNGDYIRKYLPVLKKFPSAYIYEPWKAPRSVQEQAGCIVGKDYPRPIVDHDVVSKKNIQRMKLAYARRAQLGGEQEGTGKGMKRKGQSVADLLTKKQKRNSVEEKMTLSG
nr:PREDICTED: cryptochrome-2-like [Lepisosteus oculatus]